MAVLFPGTGEYRGIAAGIVNVGFIPIQTADGMGFITVVGMYMGFMAALGHGADRDGGLHEIMNDGDCNHDRKHREQSA